MGGMRILNDELHFTPFLPPKWKGISFKIQFRGATIQIKVKRKGTTIENLSSNPITINLKNTRHKISPQQSILVTS